MSASELERTITATGNAEETDAVTFGPLDAVLGARADSRGDVLIFRMRDGVRVWGDRLRPEEALSFAAMLTHAADRAAVIAAKRAARRAAVAP